MPVLSKFIKFVLLCLLLCSPGYAIEPSLNVEIKNGWFYVNGEKFFVKGIGHELGSRPGEVPWQHKFRPDYLSYDLGLIKAAGFNTIRTWGPYLEEELAMIRESGLMAIQGFWFDVDKYINDPVYAKEMENKLRETIVYSRKFDNILFYSINNEPEAWVISKNGVEKVNEAFRRMKAIVKEADPGRGVSVSVAHWNECLDQTIWDIQFNNFYVYAPVTNVVMGYKEHLKWFKQAYAQDKPFIVGEFGLSVSKSGSKEKYGYGGNSLDDQKDGDIGMFQDIIAAGLQGGCLFMWNDGWWKSGNENEHQDAPEEWFGVVGIENEKSDPKGVPRPVYYAFKEYNRAILTSPENLNSYTGRIPVELHVASSVASVSYRIDAGKWQKLARSGNYWFNGEIDCSVLPEGKKKLEIKATGKDISPPAGRSVIVWTHKSETPEPALILKTSKDTYVPGEEMAFEIQFLNADGSPLAGKPLKYAMHNLFSGLEKQFTAETDAEGKASFKYTAYGKTTYIKFVASAELLKDGETLRYTAAKLIRIESPVNETELTAYGPRNGEILYDFDYSLDSEAVKDFSTVYTGRAAYTMNAGAEQKHNGISSLNIHYTPEIAGAWGYTQNTFTVLRDISGYKVASLWVYGDNSENSLKVMLRDEDNERWFDSEIRLTWTGWRKVIFGLDSIQRDPYDQVANGNNKPDLDKVAGLSLVMTSGGLNKTNIYLDQFELYK